MPNKGPSLKELTQMINIVMGKQILSEKKMERIMQGAKKAHDQGGMDAVLEYLMKVTQADVEFGELKKFADQIQKNPRRGLDILQGKKKPPRKK